MRRHLADPRMPETMAKNFTMHAHPVGSRKAV
jgi:hypothetical protein